MFLADLARAVRAVAPQLLPLVDFMAISAYAPDTGRVRIVKDLDLDISGRAVVVVEDIVDTGLTLQYLLELLGSRGPASLEVCALLAKPDELRADVTVRYKGFDIPSVFVVGYGLDYAERYRNLPFVGTLRPEVYQRPAPG